MSMRLKFDCVSTILSNERIARGYLKLALSCPQIARRARPGQFVMVRIDNRFDPLLRRPFSVYRTSSDQFEIVYQVVGRGTEILSTKSSGENLQVLGPIGNGFTIPCKVGPSFSAVLVGGGVAIASLMLLAVELRKRGIDVIALIGASNQDRLIGADDLAEIGAKVLVSTEDGSCGHHGLVTEMLEDTIRIENEKMSKGADEQRRSNRTLPRPSQPPPASPARRGAPTRREIIGNQQSAISNLFVYACGPYGMLKSVAKIALANDIPAQLSLESQMACGLGACLGCVIKVRTFASLKDDITLDGNFEYKRVCQDGPVFNAQEVVFDD